MFLNAEGYKIRVVGGLSLFLSSLYHVFNSFTHLFLLFFFLFRHAQKHKERDRHKPRHKKISMDMSPSLVLPNIMVPDKVTLLHSSLS